MSTNSPRERLRLVYEAALSGKFYEDYDRATEMVGWLRELSTQSEIGAQPNAAAQAAGFSPVEVPATAPLPQPAFAAPSDDKSATPRTDTFAYSCLNGPAISARYMRHEEWVVFARQLERELNAARSATGDIRHRHEIIADNAALRKALFDIVKTYNDAKSYQAVQDAAFSMHEIAANAMAATDSGSDK